MKQFHLKNYALLLLLLPVLASAQPLMRDFIGVNVKSHLPYERMNRVGFTRNFHLWADDQSNFNGNGTPDCPLPIPANSGIPKLRWNPSYTTNRYTRYDDFYALNPQRTVAVLQGNAPVMYANSGELFAKPICPEFNSDAPNAADIHADPNNWKALAIRASLFAARFGASSTAGFPTGFDQIAAQYIAAPDHTGLARGTVKYIEVFNETDAAWVNNGVDNIDLSITGAAMENNPTHYTKYYFRPDQYAAMLSAAYDGNIDNDTYDILNANNQKVGRWGIHNLSPNTKVVLAGTADMRYDYLHFMRTKWDEIRGEGNYPFDIVNYHFYSTTAHPAIDNNSTGNPETTWNAFYRGRTFFADSGQGAFPESDNIKLRERINKLLSDRNKNDLYSGYSNLFPNKPTWITEFGYDSKGASAIRVEPFCGFDAQTVQGQWITRYIMEASAAKSAEGGLVVDKVFMYELNDDPDVGDGLFGNSGLLKKDGAPKKSWYHLRTLKSVLDATRFTKTNSDYGVAFLKDMTIMPVDDPRLYTYQFSATNISRPTIAAWVPKGKNDDCTKIQYQGSILLSKSTFGTTKPTIQAIEVVENDEDGRRTKIDPSLISDISLTPPTGGSAIQYWRINGIRPGDTKVTLTETPLYLRINQPLSESDRVPQPVENLAATCLGCNVAQLTWTIPTSGGYNYYSIYYQTIMAGGPVPAFDPQVATLVTDRLPGATTNAIIPDLDINATYVFWVVPYVQTRNGGASSFFTYSPVDMSAPIAGRHFVMASGLTCSSCAIPFDESQITITQNPWIDPNNPPTDPPFSQTAFLNALFPADPATICSDLINGPTLPPAAFGISVSDGKTLQFIVDFDGPKFIDALYMYYVSGAGRITIEYQYDCCAHWVQLTEFDIKDLTQGLNNFWYRVINTGFNRTRVEKLRFTIVGLPETGIQLQRIYLCTRTAPEECEGDSFRATPQDELVTPATDLEIKNVDTHSAIIGWNAARHFVDNVEADPIHRYTLRYGIATDALGDIVQPITRDYYGDDWGGDNEVPLTPLVPNTTYYVDIFPDPKVYPCLSARPAARLSFKTLPTDENGSERSATVPITEPEVKLSPNPASDMLQVQMLPDTYTQYRILHVNGVLVREGALHSKGSIHEIGLKNLPNGMYVLTLIGPFVPTQAKAFVINR